MSDLTREARGWTPDLIAQHAVSAHDTINRLADELDRVTAERDEAESLAAFRQSAYRARRDGHVNDLIQERDRADRAESALARVKEVHEPEPTTYEVHQCLGCGEQYPCTTIRALEGDTD